MVETPSRPNADWTIARGLRVEQAIQDGDLDSLRKISALPGGFGSDSMRKRVWPILLQTERFCIDGREEKLGESSSAPHKDEAQVALDTNRSFVTYPTGLPTESKLELQSDLQDLIVGVLRKYPALSYFQGYHDILSVLYLTFIPLPAPDIPRSRTPSSRGKRRENGREDAEKRVDGIDEKILDEKPFLMGGKRKETYTEGWTHLRACAEVVSLCRVRDAMGSGMEGMMGMLKILKRILRAADPELSRFSAQISPVPTLPFFALSWILCLFSHDVDTLEPVQRMFDFLLARNPVAAIYLAVAILIAKKPQMLQLARNLGSEVQDDPSLLHPLFSRLPPLYPDTPDQPTPPPSLEKPASPSVDDYDRNPYQPIALSEIFQLTDKLMAQYRWNGPDVRANEIMGPGSVVHTYELEIQPVSAKPSGEPWSLGNALELIDHNVVLPGATEIGKDDEDEAALPAKPLQNKRWKVRIPRNRIGTAIAVGVVLLGVGIAVSGWTAGGVHSDWIRWWSKVGRRWIDKNEAWQRGGQITETGLGVARYLVQCIRGII